MININNISDWIENHSSLIIENINQESLDVYTFIMSEFLKMDVTKNFLFQFVYRSFYRIDNAGLTPEFKTEYFTLMEKSRNFQQVDLQEILVRLYNIPNRQGQKTIQFSFATKLQSTINHKSPVYDKEVAKMFSFSRPSYNLDFNQRVAKYLEQLDFIRKGYDEILKKNLIPKTMDLFENRFNNFNLSETKKLDFIFWSAGKITKWTT